MPTTSNRNAGNDNKTESDKAAETQPEETVAVPASAFEALQKQLADMQAKLDASEKAKAEAEAAATPYSNVVEIQAEDEKTEDTYIVYREHYTEDGVQKTRDFRMKSSEFATISAQRGW